MMRRLFLVVGTLLLALFFVPQLPPVRNALLRWGVSLAAQRGYDLSYQRSAGNLLYGLKLTGLSASGPGVNASVDTLKLGYTLPALVTGTLPIRAEIAGVRGTLMLDKLSLPAAGAAPAAEPAQGALRRPRIRPLLSRVSVADVALDVRGAPYTIPDLTLTSLEVEQTGDALSFDSALAAGDAVAEVSGRATLAPFSVGATVERADVALAESFFEGAKGGTLSGTVQADSSGTKADLELQNGEVALVGLDLRDVSGPVRLQGQTLTTELTGEALGGPLSGSGRVDFGAQRWQADVTGDAQLAEALTWLGRGRLSPAALETALAPSGEAEVSLTMGGWQDFTVAGSAAGEGELLGEPLTDLDVDFSFESDVGTTASADARLGGAPLSFQLTPEGDGFTLRADGADLPLHGFSGDVAVNLEQQGNALTGTSGLDLSGSALGRTVQLSADATTGGEAWQVDLSGQDELGARLSGGLELRNSILDGAVRVRDLELPGLENPVNLTALADGPLDELPLTLRVGGPQGVHPTTGGVRADADFSGEATATLEGGTLTGLRGDFGPLTVSGTLNDLAYTLAPTALSGRASGEVALRDGRLSRQEGQLETTSTLSMTGLRGGGVTLPDLNAEVSLTQTRADGLTAAVQDSAAGVDLGVQGGALTGTFEDAQLGALGDTFAVSGEVSGRLAELTETLSLDLRAQSPGDGPRTTLRAVGDAQRTRVSLRSDAGATLAGRTLGRALELSGDASPAERQADLNGTLGEVGIEVTARPDASGRVRTRAGLRAGSETFEASFDSLKRWRTDGVLPLAELGEALGVPLTGTLRSTLARRGERFSGEATAQGQIFGLPLEAEATTRGEALDLNATTTLLGRTLELSGQALPETDARLQFGEYGTLTLSGRYPALRVSGSGQLPGFTRAGLRVAAQPWQMRADLQTGEAQLRLGESVVRATRGENGWRLGAQLRQTATWRGTPLTLRADLSRTPQKLDQRPDGRVQGTLNVGGSPLTLTGSLRDLNLTGTLPAAALQSGLLGQLELNVDANVLTQSYDATTRWRRPDGTQALLLRAEGTRGELTALARAEGLNARFSTASGTRSETPAWRLEADRFVLSSLPTRQLRGLNAQLNGSLTAQDGYEGRLRLTSKMGTVQLAGVGEQLNLTATVDRGPLLASASGSALPELNLTLQASAGDAARLNGSLTGTLADPQLRASLRTAAQSLGNGQLSVPAQQLALRASLAGGLNASLTGDGVAVQLREGRWGGQLELPFTLRGTPHRLAGTLEGTLTEPVFAATLNGRTLQGPLTLSRDALAGELTVTPNLGAVPDAQVQVALNATPDLRWQLDLDGTATLPYRALPAAVQGRITGDGVRYTGEAVLTVADEAVPLSLSGEAAHFQARAVVKEVSLAPLLPARGTVSGDVRLETNGKMRYFANLNATGEALGRPFDLTLSADRASGLTLSGSAAGTGLSLTGASPFETLNLKVANSQQPLDVTASLSLGETLRVQGSGGWHGEALSVNGSYTSSSGGGKMQLELGDAALNATLRSTGAGRAVEAVVTAPTGVLSFATPVQASARVVQIEDALNLSRFDARVGGATVALAGVVRPQADVSGVLTVPAAGGPIALRLTSLETGYLAALTQGTLELRSVLSPGLIPQRVRLEGTLSRPLSRPVPRPASRPQLSLDSDLVWQEGVGFSGRADLTLTQAETAAATLTLLGETGLGQTDREETGLRVQGGASYQDTRIATLVAQLSAEPWRDRRLSGTLNLDAPLQKLSPVWPGEPLRLTGELALSDDLTAPQLAGPLALRGALTASGRLRADRQGATLSLAGDGLSATGTVGAAGYRSTLSLDALDLSGIVPQLAEPASLSGAARVAQTWGAAPQVQLADLRFVTGDSRVQGGARLAEALSGALELDVRLSDLSPNLRGRLTGPLRVGPRVPLDGALTLTDLGPAAADWALGGDLTLSGSVAQPLVRVALRSAGSAGGTVRAELAPRRGHFSLESDLAVAGADMDFVLTRTRMDVSAAGTLSYQDFEASLRTRQGQVLLSGSDRLAGWRGRYGPSRLSLRGPLASLNPQLAGTLAVTGTPDLRAVSGSLSNTTFGPVALGEVAVEGRGRQLSLRGETLAAEVELSGGLPWRLSRLTLALPGSAALTATGEGTRQRGSVSGTVTAASIKLPLRARYAPDELALEGSGSLPVGVLELRARLQDSTWQGRLNVIDKGSRVVESTLSGPLGAPTLTGRVDLAHSENTVRGTFSLGREAARLEARLSSPRLSAPVSVTGSGWPLDLALATPEDALQLALRDGRVRPSGALELGAGPANVTLQGDDGRLQLSLAVPAAPGLALRTTLPDELSGFSELLSGMRFRGTEHTSGTLSVRLRPTPRVTADALRWRSPAGTLTLTGAGAAETGGLTDISGTGISGTVQGRWRGAAEAALPWLRGADVPFTLRAEGGRLSAVSAGELGRAEAQFDTASRRFTLQSALTLGQGQVIADVGYTPEDGPSGTATLESVPVFTFGERIATLGSRLELTPGGVSGSGDLSLAGGQAALTGEAGWARLLPPSWRRLTPEGGDTLTAQVRLDRFALAGIPQVAARLPYLRAPVSGLATVTGAQIVGQLVAPELQVLETPLPTQLEFNGTVQALEVRGTFADSRLNLRYSRGAGGARIGGLVTLEQFPLQALAEAVVGASQVDAPTTGAVRFDIPLRAPQAGYVRLATERLTLKNTGSDSGGETTQGEVALRFENGSVYVERAEFRGDGFWQASGILTPAELDFTLEAKNANFTPLLRLAPRLAAFGVGAQGSLNLRASGSASAPDITLGSPRLDVSVAGTRYRALDTRGSLSGGAFGLSSEIVGVAPITGRLELRGNGQVNLAPFVTSGLALRFSGAATVPTVGRVTAIEGRIYPSEAGWQLGSSGVLGRPFTVSGGLAPLDLTVAGQGLNVQARRLFVASSTTDVALKVQSNAGGFDVSGDALVRQAQLSLDRGRTANPAAGRNRRGQPDASAAEAGSATGSATGSADPSAVATIGSVVRRTTNPALARVRFDNVRLQAPQEVIFQEAFGNAELSLDLTLSGTAAAPRLDGEAQTLRGSIRFSGQDFTLTRGVATFDPAQGAYPTLDIGATASFDKVRSLGSLAGRYSFVEPASGSSFDTLLSITGRFTEGNGGRRILDLEPTLSSDALIQEDGVGIPRPLEEAELVALLTLGRLQLDATITGSNSLAGTVAASALDTAVDLLLVSELQDALGEVLGVDLLEIRTSALSTFLGADGQAQDFGVSVRLGGYLSENLFASVQVGRYDDPEQAYALSNEFSLRYTAAALELNLSGGVNFPDRNTLSAVTDFALGLSYAVTPLISLDASLETTALGQDTSVGFGVSFTW